MKYALTAVTFLVFFTWSCKKDKPAPNTDAVPSCATLVAPANNATVTQSGTANLSWTAVSGATSYDLYVGMSTVGTGQPQLTLQASGLTTNNYTLSTVGNRSYYWYVVPRNATGAATGCASNTWSFRSGTLDIQAPPGFGYYVVGYFPSYRTLSDVPDVKFKMCNVVNYAFFSVNANKELTVPTSGTLPAALVAKAHANGAKAMMSINDGAAGNFKNMAATAAGRTQFITDVMRKVRQYGFDGVDVDWEFPSTSDGTDITFTALMKELSDSLHVNAAYYLSAAITAGKYAGGFRDAIKTELFGYVDFFNIMAYDDFSSTVPYKHHSDLALATTCLNYWINTRGMPKAKAVLGVPAYGRPSGVSQSNNIVIYRTIIASGGSPLSDSAMLTTPGSPTTPIMIYYNGQPTIKKKAILAKNMANGVMLWEKGQDTHDATSLLKAACDTVGRSY